MPQIHYRNDFMVQLRRTDSEGNTIPIPSHPWRAVLHTAANSLYSKVTAEYCNGVLSNAVIKDDCVIFVLDNHGLQPGKLLVEWHEAIPDDAFPDGARHIHCTYDTGIELVSGMGDAVTKAEVQVQVPYIWQSAYDMAVSQGYEGTMQEYVAATAQLPTAVETATAILDSVDILKNASQSVDASAKALELLSSEYADGRKAIADALTARDYPTEPGESFHSMARKIEDMSYGAGWLAKIGYTDENAGNIKEAIEYAYRMADEWEQNKKLLKNDISLMFLPPLDFSTTYSFENLFANCYSLVCITYKHLPSSVTAMSSSFINCYALNSVDFLEHIDVSTCKQFGQAFNNCHTLKRIPALDTKSGTYFFGTFSNCKNLERIEMIDYSSATRTDAFLNNSKLVHVLVKNLGKSKYTSFEFSALSVWGTGSEENRQSLIDSLITYSYDRASAGMATATITLSANTKALLTDEEIAQITAKGFTIA